MKFIDHFYNEEFTLYIEDMEKFLSNAEKKVSVPEIGKEIAKRILMNAVKGSKETLTSLNRILPKKKAKFQIFRIDPDETKKFSELKKKELAEAGKDIKSIPKDNLKIAFTPQFLIQGGDELIKSKKSDFLKELRNFLNFLVGNNKIELDSKYGVDFNDPKVISIRQKILNKFGLKPGQISVDRVNYFNNGFSVALRVK